MIILGFDPGAWTGFAIIDMRESTPVVIHAGKIRAEALDGRELIEKALGVIAPPSLVAVEKIVSVYPRAGFSTPMATAIANATRIEGRILEAASNHKMKSACCTAKEWRAALLGDAQPTDAMVKSVLERRLKYLGRVSAHARDAAGVALFCGLRFKHEAAKLGAKRSGAGA